MALKLSYDKVIEPTSAHRVVLRAPRNTVYRRVTSSGSQNSLVSQHYVVNISRGAIMSRRVALEARNLTINFRYTADPAGNDDLGLTVLNNLYDSLQSYPLNRIIATSTAQINTETLSHNNRDCLDVFLRTADEHHLFSGCNSLTTTAIDNMNVMTQEFGTYVQNPQGQGSRYENGRGAFPFVVNANPNLVNVGTVDASITVPLIVEPLINNAFSWGGYDSQEGLRNIDQLQIQLTFLANIQNHLWSHFSPQNTGGPGIGYTGALSITGVTVDAINLLIGEYQPPLQLPIVPKASYPAMNCVPYPGSSPQNVVAGAAPITFSSSNIQLVGMPHAWAVFIRDSDNTKSINLNYDRYLTINNARVTLNTRTGLLSSATQSQLFSISQQRGVDMTFPQWSGANLSGLVGGNSWTGSGSFFYFTPADIGLDDSTCPGAMGRYDFNLEVDASCPPNVADFTQAQMFVIALYPQMLETYSNFQSRVVGPLFSPEEASIGPGSGYEILDSNDLDYSMVIGGKGDSFIGKVGAVFKKAKDWLKQHGPTVLKGLKTAAQVGEMAGVPFAGPVSGALGIIGDAVGGAPMGGAEMGGAAMGGRRKQRMTLSQLKKAYK